MGTTWKEPLQNLCLNAKKPSSQVQSVKMVYTALPVIHLRLLILFEQSWHASASSRTHVGFTFNCCGQTSGVYPSCTPPLLCQLNNESFDTRLLNVWDCFLSNSSPFTGTAAGHINIVCRSVRQFVSALSLHAWGELTAKSNTSFVGCDSSRQENLGGGVGFASSMLPSLPPLQFVPTSTCRIVSTAAEDQDYSLLWLMANSDLLCVYGSISFSGINCVGLQRAERAERDVMGWIPWNPFSELHR